MQPFQILPGMTTETVLSNIRHWFDQPKPLTKRPRDLNRYGQPWAEAQLFSAIIGLEMPLHNSDDNELRPFGNDSPTLAELLQRTDDISCACFPTIDATTSKLWRLYRVGNAPPDWRDHDHHRFLADADSVLMDHEAVFLSSDFRPLERIDGNSWQLAAVLAQKTANAPHDRRTLACDWLCTGKVRHEQVEAVAISHKDRLFSQSKRRVLVPNANLADLQDSQDKADLQGVASIHQAWMLVSGQGIDKPKSISLPNSNSLDLQMLIGEAITPILAVMFLLNPHHATLWYSDKTQMQAKLVRDVLAQIPEFHGTVDIAPMDSHDLQRAYKDIEPRENARIPGRIFVITGGNRLMGIAAQLVAQAYGNLLVYRDLDAKPDTLTVIRFREGKNAESDDILINRCDFSTRLNWSDVPNSGGLYARNAFSKDTSCQEILEKLYRQ